MKNLNDKCLTNNWLHNINTTEWTNSKNQEIIKVKIEQEEQINENEEPIIEEILLDDELEDEEEPPNEEEYEEQIKNKIFTIGSNISSFEVNEYADVRPVGYLTKRILYISGNGSLENPYVIK